jgi:hypothetical protein
VISRQIAVRMLRREGEPRMRFVSGAPTSEATLQCICSGNSALDAHRVKLQHFAPTPLKTRSLIVLVSLAIGLAAGARAESGKASQSFSSTPVRQSAEELEDLGEIEASDGSESLRSKFRANINVRSDFTSNAELSGNHGNGDLLFFPTAEFGFKTSLGSGFGFDIATKLESGIFSRREERSFMGYSAAATFDWRPRPNLPRVYVGAEPYRYDSFDTGDLMTQAVGLSAGTDYGFSFNAGNSLAFFGYSFTNYFSDPSIDNRSAHRAIVGVVHQIRPQLYGQFLYAYQFSDFQEIDRDDSRHLLSLSLTYQFNRQLFGTLSGSFIDNDSTQDRASYQSALVSAGLTFQF